MRSDGKVAPPAHGGSPSAVATPGAGPLPPSFLRLKNMGAWLSSLDSVTFDETLAAARKEIGADCDPSDPAHGGRLRVWLNAWGCRIRYPRPGDTSDPFLTNLAGWWRQHAEDLPGPDRILAELSDAEIATLAHGYDALRQLVVSPMDLKRHRHLGATAAAKVLYFIRPKAVTAWDRQISRHFGMGDDAAGFLAHLARCRGWAGLVIAEAKSTGVPQDVVGSAVNRPESSVAKLLDEYLYEVISRGKRFD
jgi:hypothetical protein